jgi:hypothetical protein
MRNYRRAFFLALAGNTLLAAVLAVFWWSSRRAQPDAMPPQAGPSPASAPAETPLVPVQISPQRLQSIGVKHGRVERKTVDDEIRTAGSVAVDETHLAYVQVRFSGFIQKVFADATY